MKATNTRKVRIINTVPAGVKRVSQYNTVQNAKIFDLRAQGCSYNEIARVIKISPQRVAEILKDNAKYYEEVSK